MKNSSMTSMILDKKLSTFQEMPKKLFFPDLLLLWKRNNF